MKQKILLSTILSLVAQYFYAQNFAVLPSGDARFGMVYSYDANGNRTERSIVQLNTPYPSGATNRVASKDTLQKEEGAPKINPNFTYTDIDFAPIDALYPNPTTSIFYMEFLYEMKNATVLIMDVNGKTVLQQQVNGFKVSFNLSNQPRGSYFIKTTYNGITTSKKLIKL